MCPLPLPRAAMEDERRDERLALHGLTFLTQISPRLALFTIVRRIGNLTGVLPKVCDDLTNLLTALHGLGGQRSHIATHGDNEVVHCTTNGIEHLMNCLSDGRQELFQHRQIQIIVFL